MIAITHPLARLFVIALLCFSAVLLRTAAADYSKWVDYQPPEGSSKGKKIVFLAAGWEYRAEEGMTMLAKIHFGSSAHVVLKNAMLKQRLAVRNERANGRAIVIITTFPQSSTAGV